MEMERSAEVKVQLHEASSLREKLIERLSRAPADNFLKKKGNAKPKKHPLTQTLALSAEGFDILVTRVSVETLDRTSSMFAGPFFTSTEYPIPSSSQGMLLPVMQLNLRDISKLGDHDLGDGLLQLWCDPDWSNTDRGTVIFIPAKDIENQTLTEFHYVPHPKADDSPLPESLIFDPTDDAVTVFNGYKSTGMQCQTSYLDVYTEDIPDEVRDDISDDLYRFQEITEAKLNLHVFGSFRAIQYSAADIGWNCLVHFPRWGSDGNAQVFFIVEDGNSAFRFEESLR